MNIFRMLAIITATLSGFQAYAGSLKEALYLNTGIYFNSTTVNNYDDQGEKAKTTRKTTNLNLNINYALGNDFIVGIKYYNENIKSSDGFFSGESESITTATGVNFGYDADGLVFNASLLAIDAPHLTTGTTAYNGGGGMILDITYFIDMHGWYFGPQLSYVNIDYKVKYDDSQTTIEDSNFLGYSETKLIPYFSLMVGI